MPRIIEKPLQAVARSVGRPPRLDFTELVLCNWEATSLPVSSQKGSSEEEQTQPPQLHVMWRFLGSPDEEWYRGIHIVLNEEAREVVKAIRTGHVAMLDHNDIGAASVMVTLATWLNNFCDYFDHHFDSKDPHTESVLMRRLHPFISQGLTQEETACWVYSNGGSVLLPALHAFLGLEMFACKSTDTAEGDKILRDLERRVEEGRVFMPRAHREFLEELEKPGLSIRQYCYLRFGSRDVPVEMLHELEVSYNDAINALLRFLSRREYLTLRLFPQLAGGFGAVHTEIEETMRKSRLQLLKLRQRVDGIMASTVDPLLRHRSDSR